MKYIKITAILIILFTNLLLCSCIGNEQEKPFDEDVNHLYVRDIKISPALLNVEVDDYINLDERFKTLAIYNNNHTVKEIKIDVWQKVSGIGSVVHNEFRNYGETGEVRIKGTFNSEDGKFEKDVTIVIKGDSELPDSIIPDLASELLLLKITGADKHIGATGDDSASDDEKPYHGIALDHYYISNSEITKTVYARFLNSTLLNITDLIDPMAAGYSYTNGNYEIEFTKGNFPVTHITYSGAAEFCKYLGEKYRLPTEAEWEWAARGGVSTIYPYGSTWDENASHVNKSEIIQVKSYVFNGYRLFDMMGNVREICSDWYSSNYYYDINQYNPQGPSSGTFRVLRGGSYLKKYGVRVSERDKFLPDEKLPDVGFRVVYDPY